MLPILAAIPVLGDLVKGVTEIIDEVIEDKDAANVLKSRLVEKAMDIKTANINASRDVVVAEVKGDSFLQRNWRPILMLTFTALIVARWFGLSDQTISEKVELELWSIVQLGIGGYVAGRTAEKVVPAVADALKSVRDLRK